jgi:hypothetical protein
MRIIILVGFLTLNVVGLTQIKNLELTNALVVGQLDKPEDRYSLESLLTEILVEGGVKAMPALNVLRLGSDPVALASDSIQQKLKVKGIDTYVLVSVRGYDKRYKRAQSEDTLKTILSLGHLFPIYRDEVVSVTFEFMFYRNGKFVGTDLIKCGNVSSRETVLKRFRKKTSRKLVRKWK